MIMTTIKWLCDKCHIEYPVFGIILQNKNQNTISITMKTKLITTSYVVVALSFMNSYGQDGGQMFKTNCGACHTVGKGKLVGPDLKNVQDRHTEAWILKWVKGSQAMVQAGDKDAVQLFNDNNKIPMPDQPLADNEIKSILAFIKTGGEPATVSANPPAQTSVTENITAATQKVAEQEKSGDSIITMFSFTNYIVMFLIGILLLVIWVLAMSVKSLAEELKTKTIN
jgi:cytochrome c2